MIALTYYLMLVKLGGKNVKMFVKIKKCYLKYENIKSRIRNEIVKKNPARRTNVFFRKEPVEINDNDERN